MKVVIVLGLVAFVISTDRPINIKNTTENNWNIFKVHNNKTYHNLSDEHNRKLAYLNNKKLIEAHNKLYESGLVHFEMELNYLCDRNASENHQIYNGFKNKINVSTNGNITKMHPMTSSQSEIAVVPISIDWRQKGCVTRVKNQGQCGSCWAFSAVGAVEGQHFRKTGKLVALSEQNLMDCVSHKVSADACDGGWFDYAFEYIINNTGIEKRSFYGYEGRSGKCRYNPKYIGATITEYVSIPNGDENALMHAVATVGPVSVAIDASSSQFQFYKRGVFYSPNCSSTDTNHAVLVVGYDTQPKGGAYWIVKNSWGPNWGNKGYILMARNKSNNCGIASYASYPLS